MAKKVTKKPSKKAPVKETKKSKSAPEPKTTKKKPVPAKDTKVAKSVVAEVVYPDEDKGSEDLDIEASLAPLGVSKEDKSRALSPTDPMALYLAEIRRYPLLTKEQEVELATRYFETKDPAAAQALVTANLRFVVKVAAEYTKFGAKLIDLVQEGNVGLMHAVREFNPYKGERLITYAVWWIRGYIQEYLM
ncbi:MAG: sigma-70 family RNA polymerase sigma factor, partial [Pseudobdellovibrionaceae bacterium]